jgi:hypothetical protein
MKLHILKVDAENSNGTEVRPFFHREDAMAAANTYIDGWSVDINRKDDFKVRLKKYGYVEGFNNDYISVEEKEVEGILMSETELEPDARLKLPWTKGDGITIYDSDANEVAALLTDEAVVREHMERACNNFHAMVIAIKELTAAMVVCTTQINQMKGLFPDEDEAIANALEDAMCADQIAFVTLQQLKEQK